MNYKYLILPLIFIAITVASCTDDDNDDIIIPEDNNFLVEFIIDQDTIRYEDSVNGYGNGPGVNTYIDGYGRLHSQYTTFSRNITPPDTLKSALTVQMVKFLLDTLNPSFQTDFQLFNTGNYSYGSFNDDSTNVGVNGAVITYTDASGKTWSSDLQYGTQPAASVFNISEHVEVNETLYGGETKGTFSCTVFDGLGNSLNLTSGRFFARTILK